MSDGETRQGPPSPAGGGAWVAYLQNDAEQCPVRHAGAREDLIPASAGTGLLFLKLVANIVDLLVDRWRVRVQPGEAGDRAAGFFFATHAVGVPGRLGEQHDAAAENQRPEESQAVRDAPRRGILPVVGAIVDHLGSPDAERDKELIGRDEDASKNSRAGLRLVHGDDHRQRANAETRHQTADGKLDPRCLRRDFDNGTDAAEERRHRDGQAAAQRVRNLARDQ